MFSSGRRSTGTGRNLMDRAKPFIPKREVWEAYKRSEPTKVRLAWTANRLRTSRLICRTTSTRSGIECRPGATFRRRCDGLTSKGETGGTRPLGIPTVADRVAQMVVKRVLEPLVEPHFHDDSYGYRPGKSALDAVGVARQRCWRHAWVLISTSRPSLTVSRRICLCEQFVNIRTARGCCCTLRDG